MARYKRSIVQRNFSLGEVSEDFLEADGFDVREASLKQAKNTRILPSGVIENRQGTFFRRVLDDADDVFEFRPETGGLYGALINDNSLQIIDSESILVVEFGGAPWDSASEVWLVDQRETLFIGGPFGIYGLQLLNGSWSFGSVSFSEGPGGELTQPYWVFERGVTLQPSALAGAVTLTASENVFTDDYIGQRIRYGQREIEITARTSQKVVSGNVISELPPSYRITVSNSAGFQVGDAVESSDTSFRGLITGKTGNALDVVTIEVFEGPDTSEKLSSPNATSDIGTKSSIPPEPSVIWDEPLMSPARGYPGSAASVAGRMVYVDFPLAPNIVAASSSRNVTDFATGLNDEDAIVRSIGDGSPRILHAVAAGDLVFLCDQGCYYVNTRSGNALTPTNFNAILFDQRGANNVTPVLADDGILFVESSGKSIAAARLQGNVNLHWGVNNLTRFHEHLIKTPKKLCGPSFSVAESDRYIFVINEDGTAACVSFTSDFSNESIGFVPWETNGTIINISPIFGGYYAIVDRAITGGPVRMLEELSEDAYLDGAVQVSSGLVAQGLEVNDAGDALETETGDEILFFETVLAHLPGATVDFYGSDQYGGEFTVNADGTVTSPPTYIGTYQVGFRWQMLVELWPVEQIESARIGLLKARVIRLGISKQNSLGFTVTTNTTDQTVDAYEVGDNIAIAPIRRTKIHKFSVLGRRDHPVLQIKMDEPGPFRMLAATQEVQA